MVVNKLITEQDVKGKPILENLCPVGEPMSVEWKNNKYSTVFRGAKKPVYVVSASSSGTGKAKYEMATPGYLLIDIPVVGAKQVLFEFSASLLVRFISDGVVYGFNTHFEGVHPKPSLLVLDYPAGIQKYSLRRHERIDTVIPVNVLETGAGAPERGAILNISESGAGVALPSCNGFAVGHKISLSCTLPDGSAVADLEATIKNIVHGSDKVVLGVHMDGEVTGPFTTMRKFYNDCFHYFRNKD